MPRRSLRTMSYSELPPIHQRAILLSADGVDCRHVAKELGKPEITIKRWIGDPDGYFLPIIQKRKEERGKVLAAKHEDFQDQMLADGQRVFERMVKVALGEIEAPATVMQAASDSVLDRCGLIRSTKSENINEIKGLKENDREELYSNVLKLVEGGKGKTKAAG